MSEEVKMDQEVLTMVSVHEANNSQIIKLMDVCTNIGEFKAIYNVCNKMYKEFNRFRKNLDSKVFLLIETEVNKDIKIRTLIQNYNPEMVELDIKPLEIWTSIITDQVDTLTTRGSANYGGCNAAEYKEFLFLLKDSVKYYNNI